MGENLGDKALLEELNKLRTELASLEYLQAEGEIGAKAVEGQIRELQEQVEKYRGALEEIRIVSVSASKLAYINPTSILSRALLSVVSKIDKVLGSESNG